MKSGNRRMIVIALLMFSGAGLAWAMKPTRKLGDARDTPQLEAMVPRHFGEWKVDTSLVPVAVSPEVQAKLDRIYNQILGRTYVNPAGQRIMLSIAYGGDQSDAMRAHLPESCYTAQGFIVRQVAKQTVDLGAGQVSLMRVFARQEPRHEPITYWIRVGDKTVGGFFEQRFVQLSYGLTGRITDGVLVRVSSLSSDLHDSYALQDRFVREMLQAMRPEDREFMVGKTG
jgi:EpsI family protein